MFCNYCCRVCGNYISKEVKNPQACSTIPSRRLVTTKYHTHCLKIVEPDEKLLCDFVSISEQPLKRAVDIIYLTDIVANKEETKQ